MPNKMLFFRLNLLAVLSISLFSFERVEAAFVCYNEKYYPSVFKLVETENGIEAHLGGVYADLTHKVAPILNWHKKKGWKYVEKRKCFACGTNNHDNGKCSIAIPKWPIKSTEQPCQTGEDCRGGISVITLGQMEPGIIIKERASSCAVVNNKVWFGINFYRGEGYTGYGGIGLYNQKTKHVDVRHIPELRDYPIHKVVWDGKNVWAVTTTNYECMGHPPALGLIKYDWHTKSLTSYKGKNKGPCGFIMHDLLWAQGFLWVATDVGISRLNSKDDKWTHYLPNWKPPYNVKEGTCESFYRDTLNSLPKDEAWFDESKSYYQIFYESLKIFRPDFINYYESL